MHGVTTNQHSPGWKESVNGTAGCGRRRRRDGAAGSEHAGQTSWGHAYSVSSKPVDGRQVGANDMT